MRGSTPLDVAAASCIDNNELALALQEQDLEMVCMDYIYFEKTKQKSIVNPLNLSCVQVVTYLASCGLQMCPMLLSKGYPDIGWNPCGGERYLDFLRFAVFVNGQNLHMMTNMFPKASVQHILGCFSQEKAWRRMPTWWCVY